MPQEINKQAIDYPALKCFLEKVARHEGILIESDGKNGQQLIGEINQLLSDYQALLSGVGRNPRTKENPYQAEALVTFDLKQAEQLLDMFGGDQTLITLSYVKWGHSGEGIYAHYSEYPEEGCSRLYREEELPALPTNRSTLEAKHDTGK